MVYIIVFCTIMLDGPSSKRDVILTGVSLSIKPLKGNYPVAFQSCSVTQTGSDWFLLPRGQSTFKKTALSI